MLDHKNIKKSQFKKCWMGSLGSVLIISMLSACSNFGMDHSVCDLRVLSLQISKQSEVAITGNVQAINELKKSQEKLNLIAPSAIKKISNQSDAEHLQRDVSDLNSNIDLIVKSQKQMNSLHDLTLAASEVIPGIQAEYNLMVDQMARENYPSTQVVLAKNQVFMAERILRTLHGVTNGGEYAVNNMEDVLADIETLNAYLKAQLNGNAELGVDRIKDPELRESLASIQGDIDGVLISGSNNLRDISDQIIRVSDAIKKNQKKSDEIFNALEKLE